MIACPYQDLFPYINDAILEKLNSERNEKDDILKEFKSDTRPSNENNRCRMDETVNNRLSAGLTILINRYLMEALPVPVYELCHSLAMTVKNLLADCVNTASLRRRFLDGSIPNTLEKIPGRKQRF